MKKIFKDTLKKPPLKALGNNTLAKHIESSQKITQLQSKDCNNYQQAVLYAYTLRLSDYY